ncbi:uncharacterized protein EAF02_008094 [Botrytis sinoallii]|uniref:uncharacterized protein n=1 Tax=Botrytis sinoallii TaxID=1463999 RepID=UPI001900F024|nr:uncharacterized protein EAF02_008094 [Botrytis sinoallii]KAF7876874.1 hypothetical protein EAF02_008094 [Botrytis sinoallii]
MLQLAQQDESNSPDAKKFSIISGTSFGSSFMVQARWPASDKINSVVKSLQQQMDLAKFYEGQAGGFVWRKLVYGKQRQKSAQFPEY